ncbi:MAG: iron-sulfur cluster biosynthesis family protein [Nitrospirota bacterium]
MLEVSEKAINEFKKVLESQDEKGLGVKIKAFVAESSCCSCGPSQNYEMDLVKKGEKDDAKVEMQGVSFYMDKETTALMEGLQVDFMEDHGFIIKETGEASSCGCGSGGHGGSCC